MTEAPDVYANAPLRLVTLEVRFNYQPRFNERAARDRFGTALSDAFPLKSEDVLRSKRDEKAEPLRQVRGVNDARSRSVSLSANSLSVIESGDAHERFEDLLPALALAYTTVLDVAPDTRIARVGVRYFNELRLPVDDADTASWRRWVVPELIGPADALSGAPAQGVTGQATYSMPAPEHQVRLQYGDGYGQSFINPEIPLSIAGLDEESDFFVLDIDSGWECEPPRHMEEVELRERFLSIHEPIRQLFEWCITDDARSAFTNREPNDHKGAGAEQ